MKKLFITTLLLWNITQASSNVWNNLTTTATLSYDTSYILHGYNFGANLVHADISFWMPVSEKVSVWAGSWYGTQFDETYKEIDFYAGVDYQLTDHVSAGLAYSLFNYMETPYPTSSQAHEFSGHITYVAGPLTLSLHDLYDSEGDGHLTRAIAVYDHRFCDTFGLSLSAEYGYSFDYFEVGDGPNHALFKATFPVQLNDTLSVSPFIAHSIALDVLDSFEKDQTYGGISISATF